MATRGVVYVCWGRFKQPKLNECLLRSIESLKKHHPKMAVTIHDLPDNASLLDKPCMYDVSPYDETLFLDTDTTVLGDLTFGFDKAIKHDLACCICEAPWGRRYRESIAGDAIEYNTGVLFFRKSDRCKQLFDTWKELAKTIDSSIVFHTGRGNERKLAKMPHNDQASFALAVERLDFNPYVLPLNWNFRPLFQKSWFGPLKVWHDYSVPDPALVARNAQQSDPQQIMEFTQIG